MSLSQVAVMWLDVQCLERGRKLADKDSCTFWSKQGFGARTKILRSSSNHLKFLDPASTSTNFGSGSKMIWSIEN